MVILLLAAPLAGGAQQTAKIYRIGFLSPHAPAQASPYLEAFQHGLREYGYIEGQNIAIEYRWAEAKLERLPDRAAELVQLKVNLIVTVGIDAAQAAKRATSTIPIVFWAVPDPIGSGLVASLVRPGGNVTGITALQVELIAKRLELLKEAVPTVTRVGILRGSALAGPVLKDALKHTETAAQQLGVQTQIIVVRKPNEFATAFSALTRERADALFLIADPLFYSERARIVEFATKSQLPVMAWRSEFVRSGGLISYGSSEVEDLRRVAYLVDKILKGAKPSDLPVEQPTKFELVLNLKTATALGLTIPPSVLLQADQVIE